MTTRSQALAGGFILLMFNTINNDELFVINGGFKGEDVAGGSMIFIVGVGLVAAATVPGPGLNVVAAAGLAYAGSWGLAGGITMGLYGLIA